MPRRTRRVPCEGRPRTALAPPSLRRTSCPSPPLSRRRKQTAKAEEKASRRLERRTQVRGITREPRVCCDVVSCLLLLRGASAFRRPARLQGDEDDIDAILAAIKLADAAKTAVTVTEVCEEREGATERLCKLKSYLLLRPQPLCLTPPAPRFC